MSQITPVDDRQSRVYTYIAYRFPVPRWVLRILRPFIHLYTHIVIQQDVRIIQAHREGLDNAAGFKPCNVPADAIHVGVEQLLLRSDAARRCRKHSAASGGFDSNFDSALL